MTAPFNADDFPPLVSSPAAPLVEEAPVLKLKLRQASPPQIDLSPPPLTCQPMQPVHRPLALKGPPPSQWWYTDLAGTLHIMPVGVGMPNVPVARQGVVQDGKLIGFE